MLHWQGASAIACARMLSCRGAGAPVRARLHACAFFVACLIRADETAHASSRSPAFAVICRAAVGVV
eukprot:2423589-Pleurochrysis_carterae.AAC.1